MASQASADAYSESLIHIDVAASMLKQKISKNERPYSKKVMELNNERVEMWKETLLKKISKDSHLQAANVVFSWDVFAEADEVRSTMENIKYLPQPTEEQIQHWKNIFEQPVEELYNLRSNVISQGWSIILQTIKLWGAKQKWERIYCSSSDPVVWYERSKRNLLLVRGEELPFWSNEIIKDYAFKVHTILSYHIDPKKV